MVYNPVIIFLPLQGDGMVGKITRRLKGGKIQYNSQQETKQKSNNYREKKPSGLTKIKGSGQRWRKKP